MTQNDKVEMVQAMLDNEQNATLSAVTVCLSDAKDAILRRMYPFETEERGFPVKYDMLQCKLAARYFTRKGGEGESMHIENGTHRRYDTVNDEDLLMEVTPHGKVM